MSSLSSYLAKNYLTPSNSAHHEDGRPKKRRKKDKQPTTSSLIIADDDDLLLSGSKSQNGGEENEDGMPMMYEGRTKSAEFRKKKTSAWRGVGQAGAEQSANGLNNTSAGADGEDEADRILASAAEAQSERQREIEMEDAPAIVSTDKAPSDDGNAGEGVRMESGVRPGLQTVADTEKLIEKERRQKRREEKSKAKSSAAAVTPQEETIYRDASGRVINLSTRRAEIAAQQRAVEQAKRKEREEAMGDVQRRQKEERKQELDDAKFLSIGRGADDEEMNDMLRDRQRWDDPMAGYMAEKRGVESEDDVGTSKGSVVKSGGVATKSTAKSKSKSKIYQGHAPPNRYGIVPGWRWDGVDRGNGFEKDWFQARSRGKRIEELSYAWQQDE